MNEKTVMSTQGIDRQFSCFFDLEAGRETTPLKGFEARTANQNRGTCLSMLNLAALSESSAAKFAYLPLARQQRDEALYNPACYRGFEGFRSSKGH
jgi:hypothetical protein